MTEGPRRAYLPLPNNYYDLTDEQQDAVCRRMAQALIAELAEPDGDGDVVENECPDRRS